MDTEAERLEQVDTEKVRKNYNSGVEDDITYSIDSDNKILQEDQFYYQLIVTVS